MFTISVFVCFLNAVVLTIGLNPYDCVQWGDTNCCRLYETESLTENAPHTSVVKDSLWKCQDVCWNLPCGPLLYYKHLQSCTVNKSKFDKNNPPKCWAKWIPMNGLDALAFESPDDVPSAADFGETESPVPSRKDNSYSRALNLDADDVSNSYARKTPKELLFMADGILQEPNFKDSADYFLPTQELVIYPNNLIQIVTSEDEPVLSEAPQIVAEAELGPGPEAQANSTSGPWTSFVHSDTVESTTPEDPEVTDLVGTRTSDLPTSQDVSQNSRVPTTPTPQVNKFNRRPEGYGRAMRIDIPQIVRETEPESRIASSDCEVGGINGQEVICRNISHSTWSPEYLLWGAVGIACCVMVLVVFIAVRLVRRRKYSQKEVIPERPQDFQDDSSSYGPEELDVDLALQV